MPDPQPLEQVLLQREAVQRTRKHEDPAVQRALDIAGQDLNPVKLVDPMEAQAIYSKTIDAKPSPKLQGFRAPQSTDPTIYVNRESNVYKNAAKNPNNKLAQLLLASLLIHEQTHDEGSSELVPQRFEADFLRSKRDMIGWPDKGKLDEMVASINRFLEPSVSTTGKK